jgi:probable HAF family extracellular repeat protein
VEAGRVVGNPGFLFEGDKLTTIPPLPGGNTVTVARINASRVIVGSWGDTVKGPFPLAFRWENGVMHDLSPDLPLPGLSSALDINDQGAITGWMGETPQSSHAFIWQNGKATDIGLMPGSFATQGWGISNRNQICGTARFPTDEPPGFVTRGFIWERGIFTDLGLVGSFPALHPRAINDDGTVVGHANFGSGGGIGFVWKAGVLRRITDLLPPNVSGGCTDINSRGEIALSGNVVVRPGEPSEQVGVRLRPIPREPGDTNCDGMINLADLIAVLINWGQKGSDADVNGTGLVDVDDLIVVILNWG